MATAVSKSVLDFAKGYLLARWKRRWPILPAAPFFVAGWAMTADQRIVHQQLHKTIIGAVIFIVVGILFPFRWRGEDWEESKTR